MSGLVITRELQLSLAVWNAEIERARREYSFHPFSQSCGYNHRCPNRMEAKK